jgi:predicted HTH transcriptional regulator
MNLVELLSKINSEKLQETLHANVELKSSWDQSYGKIISAIANELRENHSGFLVLGISDYGKVLNTTLAWLNETESRVSNHVRQYLNPTQGLKIQGHQTPQGGVCLVLCISSPNDITLWNNKAYKRVGTQTEEMTPYERIALSLALPGNDYTKQGWKGAVSGSLVEQFALKIALRNKDLFPEDLTLLSPAEILERIGCVNKMASRILFGDTKVRIAYYDASGDVIEQSTRQGVFTLLSDDFLAEVNRWTKGKGTLLNKNSLAAISEEPYPIKALRESIANAVCHSLYERDDGDILLDLHTDRFVIRNNCGKDVSGFAKEWFSKKSWTRNKFLMQLLRESGYTDELGSGKTRLFNQMLESGKKEPIVEYYPRGEFACWQVTLYNSQDDFHNGEMLTRLKGLFLSVEDARLAMALVLWRNQKWSEILEKLDSHYKNIAERIISSHNSPIVVIGNEILTKRWASCALNGKTTMAFTPQEETLLRQFFQSISYQNDRQGVINTEEAKKIIGLSNTPSESTQLSNLFRKWAQSGFVKNIGRGKWRFETPSKEEIFSISQDFSSLKKDVFINSKNEN